MDVVVYTQPGDENSRRIKELLSNIGVTFEEQVCADGKVDGRTQVPLTVVDGVAIPGMNRARIEQAIGWVGF